MNSIVKPRICINVISGAPRAVMETCLAQLDAACQAVRDRAESQVLFVDNSGKDADVWVRQAYPAINYVAQSAPRSFAANANLALRQQDVDAVLLLNSDAFLGQDTLSLLLDALQAHSHWAAVSAHLQNPDSSDQGTAFDFPTLRSTLLAMTGLRRRCFLHGCQRRVGDDDVEADWVPATCLLVRRTAIETVGVFDEAFTPGYGEDIDWCRRASRAGWRVGVCAGARVTHLGGATFGALGAARFVLFVQGLCRYHNKHADRLSARLTILLMSAALTMCSMFPVARRSRVSRRGLLSGSKLAFRCTLSAAIPTEEKDFA
jgi:GT2 family glycosyltransferase